MFRFDFPKISGKREEKEYAGIRGLETETEGGGGGRIYCCCCLLLLSGRIYGEVSNYDNDAVCLFLPPATFGLILSVAPFCVTHMDCFLIDTLSIRRGQKTTAIELRVKNQQSI